MTDRTTTTVTFTVTRLERVRGAGRLVALVTVELELEGVVLVMQGVRVVRDRDRMTTQAPRFRNPLTGAWVPALLLPDELGQAIANEVHELLCESAGRSP